MTRKAKGTIVSLNLRWRLYQRGNTYYADGRSNDVDGGRHSLETDNLADAKRRVIDLDLLIAAEQGILPAEVINSDASPASLSLAEGRDRYIEHLARPAVTGGASARTRQRYKAVFDKFLAFAEQRHVTTWQGVTRQFLQAYGRWLEEEEYAYRTQTLELTTIKQAVKFLIGEELLPEQARLKLPLKKASGTPTYCYTREEVAAMIAHCRADKHFHWLADVVTALAHTGMRISELADLRWSDIDMERKVIHLKDESRGGGDSQRTTKTHRDRVLPVHDRLHAVLEQRTARQGRVFRGPRGGVLKPDTVRNILKRDVIEPLAERFPRVDGVKGFVDGRVHSFRHFFCSVCADEGIPEQMLMGWLGHANSAMIRHYYHASESVARERINAVQFTPEEPE